MTVATVADIAGFLQRFAPLELAESWDNVGLLLGDPRSEVQRLMTCLTVTPASAAEAIDEQAQLIVSHHPVLFRPVQRIIGDTPQGRMLLGLLQAGVAVYSPHTAFDNCTGGINDILCRGLGLTNVQPLRPSNEPGKCKIVVFVPENDLARVSDALFSAGAGVIGQYSQCSFRLAGMGTFFGSDAAQPTVGKKGRREEVSEWRLEVVCPETRLADAVRAMRKAHSYEEPAFDVYPLHPMPGSLGAGRIGTLPTPQYLQEIVQQAAQTFASSHALAFGDPDQPMQRIAVVCGAGGGFLDDCRRVKADLFVTGELRFHDQIAAEAEGFALLLLGHYETERPGVEELARILDRTFSGITVWASQREAGGRP